MKLLLVLAFALSVSTFYAQQRITVIDKSPENTFLFDETNPQSLVSLFNNNSLPFNPMSLNTSIRLANAGMMENKPTRLGNQSNTALINKDGEDSMARINGYYYFVYPTPDMYFTDLDKISRLLIYEHETLSNGKNEFLIDSIGYAKKYDSNLPTGQAGGKFELLGTISFKALSTDYTLFYTEELNSESLNKLLAGDFLVQIKANESTINPFVVRPILKWHSALAKEYGSIIFDVLQPERQHFRRWNNQDYNWPINQPEVVINDFDSLEKHYGAGNVAGFLQEQSDIPLATIDGEDSIMIHNGVMQFVYPKQLFYTSWIEVKPGKAWLVYSVSSETLTPKNKLERILFTNSENELLADFNCSDPRIDLYAQYLKEAGIQLEVPVQENWKTALLRARLSGKKYAVSKKGDLKKLAKEFEVMEDVVR